MNPHPVTFEFHVSRLARDRYRFDDVLFTLTGNLVFANFHAARVFAQKMNEQRDLVSFPEQAVKAGLATDALYRFAGFAGYGWLALVLVAIVVAAIAGFGKVSSAWLGWTGAATCSTSGPSCVRS